jgi:hypothetical protein
MTEICTLEFVSEYSHHVFTDALWQLTPTGRAELECAKEDVKLKVAELQRTLQVLHERIHLVGMDLILPGVVCQITLLRQPVVRFNE